MLLNNGEELAWVCLGSCSLDVRHLTFPVSRSSPYSPSANAQVVFNATAVFWMTSRTPAAAQHPADVDIGPARHPSARVRPASPSTSCSLSLPRTSLDVPRRASSAPVFISDADAKRTLGKPDVWLREGPLPSSDPLLARGTLRRPAHRVRLTLTLGAPSELRPRASSMSRIVSLLHGTEEHARHRSSQASFAATAPPRIDGSLSNVIDYGPAGI